MNQMAGSQLTPTASTTESDMLFPTRDGVSSRSLASVSCLSSYTPWFNSMCRLSPPPPPQGIIPTANPPTTTPWMLSLP